MYIWNWQRLYRLKTSIISLVFCHYSNNALELEKTLEYQKYTLPSSEGEETIFPASSFRTCATFTALVLASVFRLARKYHSHHRRAVSLRHITRLLFAMMAFSGLLSDIYISSIPLSACLPGKIMNLSLSHPTFRISFAYSIAPAILNHLSGHSL